MNCEECGKSTSIQDNTSKGLCPECDPDKVTKNKQIAQLQSKIETLTAELEKLKKQRISNSCVPCVYLGGDCCGVMYWSDEGKILCNECGREFEVALKASAANERGKALKEKKT